MKHLAVSLALIFSVLYADAQSGYNYKEFAVGMDLAYERGYTNINRQQQHFGESINFIYNYSPYIPVTAELQFGTLSGGGLTPKLDRYGRQFTNKFEAFTLHADFQLGEVIDYSESGLANFIKNVYFGTGIGMVFNNNTVQRTNLYPWNGSLTYVFPGSDHSVNTIIPFRFGYEIKFYNFYNEPWMAIDFGYVHNMVFGEGLDGYDDPTGKFKNNATNQYRQITVGVKFHYGNITSFNKNIRRQ